MTNEYWRQWDKEDLDDWQGKKIVAEDEIDEEIENEPEEEKDDFDGGSFDSYGMSWKDFM